MVMEASRWTGATAGWLSTDDIRPVSALCSSAPARGLISARSRPASPMGLGTDGEARPRYPAAHPRLGRRRIPRPAEPTQLASAARGGRLAFGPGLPPRDRAPPA